MTAAAAPQQATGAAAGPSQPTVKGFDFLVLGSGIAGLSYALKVAEHGTVAIITKAEASEGSTRWAQGGICAVLDDTDSPESHIYDTIVAGDFENDRRCALILTTLLPAASCAETSSRLWPPGRLPQTISLLKVTASYHCSLCPTESLTAATGQWKLCAMRAQPQCWSWPRWVQSSRRPRLEAST